MLLLGLPYFLSEKEHWKITLSRAVSSVAPILARRLKSDELWERGTQAEPWAPSCPIPPHVSLGRWKPSAVTGSEMGV